MTNTPEGSAMSEPVYQSLFIETEFHDGWRTIDKQTFEDRSKLVDRYQVRILYPASAYEALKAETEAQAKQIAEAVNRIKDMLENDDGQAHKEARKFIESLAASEYQEPEQLCDDGGKCGAGGYCNNCAAPVVKENGKLRERLANQHAKIEQLRASLQECLDRAIEFLNDEIGAKPSELFDYDGWDERARNLLSQDIGEDE